MQFEYKKSLGQNFIYDLGFLRSIVRDLNIRQTDIVWEIGTGAGTLTKVLAECGCKVHTVEIDERLRPVLEKELPSAVDIIFGDAMKLDFAGRSKFRLVANVPYYITTPILMKFLNCDACNDINILVARDVADRIVANPATPEYGALSVKCQICGKCEIVKIVPAQMFTPKPKIDSAFVRIVKQKPISIDDRILKLIFAARRKTILNALSSALSVPKTKAETILISCGISPLLRAENIAPTKFAELLQKSAKADG
jgi:16S rRNA (adenine1518-N6/adenine1519-N6)-dimethyltransferase